MPELPEVETIVRNLRNGRLGAKLPGQKVTHVSNDWPRHIATPEWPVFAQMIRGRVIRQVQRRGKFLVLPLSSDYLLLHLRMSGDLSMAPSDKSPERHEHTIFHFQSGWSLRFNDTRKFGRVYLTAHPDDILGDLGPEPLSAAFTANQLFNQLQQHKRMIKPILLDQHFIAGMGNIYTDEALHIARIHPRRRSHTITESENLALWQAIRTVLQTGIDYHGASIDWIYRGGDFQNFFRVYHRTGLECRQCGQPIQRILVGQRGTHICPGCQKGEPA